MGELGSAAQDSTKVEERAGSQSLKSEHQPKGTTSVS